MFATIRQAAFSVETFRHTFGHFWWWLIVAALGCLGAYVRLHHQPAVQSKATSEAAVLGEVTVHLPARLPETSSAVPVHLDPAADLNAYWGMVRRLDTRYLEREEFLHSMVDKRVRWRGYLRNAGTLDSGEVGIVIDANPPASRSSNLGRVEFKRKLRTKVFSLHDGDLIEISGVYVGEGWLSQPWIDGDTVQLVSDVALTSRADERRK